MSQDVVLHLRNRLGFFREVARLLSPAGRFLFTDASVVTGSVSNEEVLKRSPHGYTQFVVEGWNEGLLASAGFELIEIEDRTMSVHRNAEGRLAAMHAHRDELERVSNTTDLDDQEEYLGTVVELSRRKAVSCVMYLTEVRADSAMRRATDSVRR